ncbi:hypothetical protein HBZS_118630 [Helicobacter bizzozeronii CCUG 35545]|nr:hypothetical protein HBZS_118630 [Helicobacter bizzozeronii CCUG 35545]
MGSEIAGILKTLVDLDLKSVATPLEFRASAKCPQGGTLRA